MKETLTLPEVVHQVDKANLCQHFGNNLAARVSGFVQVHVDIFHQDGVLAPEALQGLL